MKIDSSNVTLQGSSSSTKKTTQKQTTGTIRSSSQLNLTEADALKRLGRKDVDTLTVLEYTQTGKKFLNNKSSWNSAEDQTNKFSQSRNRLSNVQATASRNQVQKEVRTLAELKMELMEKIFSVLWGKQFKFSKLDLGKQSSLANFGLALTNGQQSQDGTYITVIDHFSYESYEQETMSFDGSVSVKTADGRSINVDLSLNMSRELYQKFESFSIQETFHAVQTLCDPLIINFGNESAELSDIKFSFDLDCDGRPDQISMLGKGSGFLALDLNGDGIINDGSELFGAKSGNGFYDLAQYDVDGNGWIDENDPIFESLRIWTKDEKGNDVLLTLGEVGIGAIYLGYAETNYALKNDDGQLNGVIRKTGVFLREDGTSGTVQHVDLTI